MSRHQRMCLCDSKCSEERSGKHGHSSAADWHGPCSLCKAHWIIWCVFTSFSVISHSTALSNLPDQLSLQHQFTMTGSNSHLDELQSNHFRSSRGATRAQWQRIIIINCLKGRWILQHGTLFRLSAQMNVRDSSKISHNDLVCHYAQLWHIHTWLMANQQLLFTLTWSSKIDEVITLIRGTIQRWLWGASFYEHP